MVFGGVAALSLRRRGWWIALATLVLMVATFVVGWAVYDLAVTP